MLSLAAMHTTSTPVPEAVSALQAATQADRAVVTVHGVGQQAFDAAPDGCSSPWTVRTDPASCSSTPATARSPTPSPPRGRRPTCRWGSRRSARWRSATPRTTRRRRPTTAGRSPSSSPCPGGNRSAPSTDPPGRTRRSPTTPPAGGSARRATTVTGATRSWCGTSPTGARGGRRGDRVPVPPGQRTLVADPDSPGLTVFDLSSGAVREDHQIRRPDTPYNEMAVDPSGRFVVVDSLQARRADVLDLATGSLVTAIDMPSPGSLDFSGDGKHLAIGGGGRRSASTPCQGSPRS